MSDGTFKSGGKYELNKKEKEFMFQMDCVLL